VFDGVKAISWCDAPLRSKIYAKKGRVFAAPYTQQEDVSEGVKLLIDEGLGTSTWGLFGEIAP
jgi:hypothetical protein